MITVTYLGESYECVTALKGADYIHLLDSEGCMVAAFDGVSDFSDFAITGGDWTIPTPEQDCYLAVVKEDGTIGKGGHRCCDIPTETVDIDETPTEGSTNPISSGGVYAALKGDLLLAEPIRLSNSGGLSSVDTSLDLWEKKIEIEYRIYSTTTSYKDIAPHRFVAIRLTPKAYVNMDSGEGVVAKDAGTGHVLVVGTSNINDNTRIQIGVTQNTLSYYLDIVQIRVLPEV